MRPANEKRRCNIWSSLISWAHTQYDPCVIRIIIIATQLSGSFYSKPMFLHAYERNRKGLPECLTKYLCAGCKITDCRICRIFTYKNALRHSNKCSLYLFGKKLCRHQECLLGAWWDAYHLCKWVAVHLFAIRCHWLWELKYSQTSKWNKTDGIRNLCSFLC